MQSPSDSAGACADRNDYGGIVAAAVTPCSQTGIVDPAAMQGLCRRLIDRGCQGIFAISSTGESPLLDEDDRQALVEAAAAGIKGRGVLYAGVAGLGLKQSLRYARMAAQGGAQVAVIMAPFFLKYSQAELIGYVSSFADQCPLPVALYHHLRMPTSFDVDTVAKLARHDNIVAIKDTSGELERMQMLVKATAGQHFSLLQGSERLLAASLQAGGHGSVTALANIVPEWHAALVSRHRAGDGAGAEHFQDQIIRLCGMFDEPAVRDSLSHFVYTLKHALVLRGWLTSPHGMMPAARLDEHLRTLIEKHLAETDWCDLLADQSASDQSQSSLK